MPFRFVLVSGLLALVPVFGLTSCAKDKPDDWSMSEPTVVGTNLSLKVTASGDRTLPADAELRFNGARYAQMHVHSDCTPTTATAAATAAAAPTASETRDTREHHTTDDFDFSYRDKLAVRELWPREFVARLSATQLEATTCDFHFTAESESGSTQEFAIEHSKLAQFFSGKASFALWKHSSGSFAQFDAWSKTQPPLTPSNDANTLRNSAEDLIEEIGGADELSLVCGEHASSLDPAKEEPEPLKLMGKLALSEVQQCHLLATRHSETSTYAMSTEFPLRFSRPNLVVKSWFEFSNQTGAQNGLRIQIANPSSSDVLLSIPLQAPTLRYRYAGNMPTVIVSSKESSAQLAVNVDRASPESEDGSRRAYRLRAGQTALVSLTGVSSCVPTLLGNPGAVIGLKYGLETPYEILQEGAAIYEGHVWQNVYEAPSAIAKEVQQIYGAELPAGVTISTQPASYGGCY